MHVYTILQLVRNSVFIYEKKTNFKHESFPCITRREKYFFMCFVERKPSANCFKKTLTSSLAFSRKLCRENV